MKAQTKDIGNARFIFTTTNKQALERIIKQNSYAYEVTGIIGRPFDLDLLIEEVRSAAEEVEKERQLIKNMIHARKVKSSIHRRKLLGKFFLSLGIQFYLCYDACMMPGDCVQTPDGRIGRVRDILQGSVRVRVMRKTSKTHHFVLFSLSELKVVACPKGWMSPEGYNRYLSVTLAKMKKRLKKQHGK